MTDARIFTPENHLCEVLSDAFGMTGVELSTASQTLVAGMAAGLYQQLQEEVARLVALREGGDAAVMSRLPEAADVAMSIVEIAAVAGRPQLGEAARGILAMADGLAGASRAYKDAMIVHMSAVALLGAEPPPSQNDAASVLRQLLEMRRFLGVTD